MRTDVQFAVFTRPYLSVRINGTRELFQHQSIMKISARILTEHDLILILSELTSK